jgi:transposase-like protein
VRLLVFEQVEAYSSQWEAIRSIAAKVGVPAESLRRWGRQAGTDAGARPGVTSVESEWLRELERENRECVGRMRFRRRRRFSSRESSTLDRRARKVHRGT